MRLNEITIAGKTGFTEKGRGKNDHSWFADFVPAARPKYAFAVVIEYGSSGSRVAGPVAQKLAPAMLQIGLPRPMTARIQAN